MLRSPSAGKLLQYMVEDGGHVDEGKVFAEIEVSFAEELEEQRSAKTEPRSAAVMLVGCAARGCCWLGDGLPLLPQVMKIIMTLAVEEAGRLHYIKRPGALLEAGCIIARLELDDPSKVKPVSLLAGATLLSPPTRSWSASWECSLGDKIEELP